MVMAKSCPRCRGDLAFVDDIGDSYYSCVQCGHIVYRLGPALAQTAVEERTLPTALTREEIHRRRIRKQNAARRSTSAA